MNHYFSALKSIGANLLSNRLSRGVVGAIAALLLLPLPSLAHHPLGGQVPSTFAEGFLSGLGHPIIGLDHLAFVVAVGLLAAVSTWGIVIPVAFVLAAMAGTGLHLAAITLPMAELIIAGSVLGFGVLLALKNRPQSAVVAGLAAIAGLFHGFAYGEAVFGAQTVPLAAYLAGFTVVQMAIAVTAFVIGRQLTQRTNAFSIQPAGLVICGIGATFLATALLNAVLPV
ncbi:HupE/UreJ family protein [Nodosilinea sp. LEGE 07298]|uniref:HupE/UreJ family protein n=1 Tax=Nodosilinea sp. LEGE 07298 TaxID=2777970 RepID=UPI0018819627|nr:HupE/UreJ family protein [Nodosilinea sp. LEGE 07298]MBE9108797.1 HupE/UreJ family protein [Nodosilinea sp. LEGE 07298]